MTDQEYLPSDVTYSYKRFVQKRDTIIRALDNEKFKINGRLPWEVVGDHFDTALEAVLPVFTSNLMGDPFTIEQTLHNLLSAVKSGYPTKEDYATAAYIMAANEGDLVSGKPLMPFDKLTVSEWVPVKALDYSKDYSPESEGGWMTFICLGGRPATYKFKKYCVNKFINVMKTRMFGLAKFSAHRAASELVGLKTWVKLEPRFTDLSFSEFGITKALEQDNKQLIRERSRPCVVGLSNPCTDCHIGIDTCHRATHYDTYEIHECPSCEDVNAWFRRGDEHKSCIRCLNKYKARKLAEKVVK